MKKLFSILTLFVVMSFTANAQFKKADKFVEGTASYTKTEGTDGTYGLSPVVGYFVNDKMAIGAYGEFSKNETTKTNNVGVFGRHYFLNIGKNFKTFSQLSVLSSTTTVAGEKTSGVSFNFGLGANYFVTSRLALSTSLGNLMSYDGGSSEFSIGFSGIKNPISNPSFGVLYKF